MLASDWPRANLSDKMSDKSLMKCSPGGLKVKYIMPNCYGAEFSIRRDMDVRRFESAMIRDLVI